MARTNMRGMRGVGRHTSQARVASNECILFTTPALLYSSYVYKNIALFYILFYSQCFGRKTAEICIGCSNSETLSTVLKER